MSLNKNKTGTQALLDMCQFSWTSLLILVGHISILHYLYDKLSLVNQCDFNCEHQNKPAITWAT